ncbi:5-formyltetrahydrofolate cyclo-ligase [Pleomorphomonas oryzae]|uniref:5-formyltetrahydrofolate cyclo-ligase n=1 Tax=Pleomorphomonas oryzae TaxID=261934 RepID=UPI0004037F90|nr:5-formyltetrahydrofolate cyclo-ligase [Pleomorphomonas oryzae]
MVIPVDILPDPPRALIAAEKARVRKLALTRRDAVDEAARAEGSAAISATVLALDLQPSCAVSAFLPIQSEVDLGEAIAGLDARGHPIGLPIMVERGLIFRRFRPGDALVPLGFGTRGPGPEAAEVVPDVLLMPLSAFDRLGGRVGYGRGYYDRTVAGLRAAGRFPRLIGIAFSVQEVATVPMEPHDAPLDMIVTERDVFRFVR